MCMHSPKQLLLVAQLCLLLSLAVCVLLIPHFLFDSNEGGVSNYGTYTKTIIPYSVGFSICGLVTVRAAFLYPRSNRMRPLLAILGLLYILVLLSTYPYKQGALFNSLHHILSALLVLYALGYGTWLALFRTHSIRTRLLYAAQLSGFLLALLTFLGSMHLLFIGEFLENTSFGGVLVFSL